MQAAQQIEQGLFRRLIAVQQHGDDAGRGIVDITLDAVYQREQKGTSGSAP